MDDLFANASTVKGVYLSIQYNAFEYISFILIFRDPLWNHYK